jgi:hypothetical protein
MQYFSLQIYAVVSLEHLNRPFLLTQPLVESIYRRGINKKIIAEQGKEIMSLTIKCYKFNPVLDL